jgi:erythromycin esterase
VTKEVRAWIDANAVAVGTDPAAPLDDLAPFEASLADAVVVAVGDAVRGVRTGHEPYRLRHRVLRITVERLGFRALAVEERDAAVGSMLDEYIRAGAGDARTLVTQMWAPWQTQETLDMLGWLRSYNAAHPGEMVRVVAVASDRQYGLAEQTLAWRDRTGDKIVYLGGIAHTAVCRTTRISVGSAHAGIQPRPNDGSALRDRLGSGYHSVGLLCHHGPDISAPPEHFAEAVLGGAGPERYWLDLRRPGIDWLARPTTVRVIGPAYDPAHDADYCMSGEPLAAWFDSIIFNRTITPAALVR